MGWFRMYNEIVYDPKVIRLSDKEHRAWVNMLAIASMNGGVLPPLEDVALHLRTTEQRAASLLSKLCNRGFLDKTEHGIEPHNWKQRQYVSDCSTPRVRKHRETFPKRPRNVSETPSEQTTEQTTEQTQTQTQKPLAGADLLAWPESTAIMQSLHPDCDGPMARKVIAVAQAEDPEIPDSELARGLGLTHKRNQESAALWLRTIGTWVKNTRQRRQALSIAEKAANAEREAEKRALAEKTLADPDADEQTREWARKVLAA